MTAFLHALLFLLATVTLLWALGQAAMHWRLAPEITRKIAHILLGLATLTFPWLFTSPLPVWVIAVTTTALILACRTGPRRWRVALHRVGRSSVGDLCYPASVALIFQLSMGDPLYFCVPILVVALADAAGALVGIRYGFGRFGSGNSRKSLEGSVAVGATTFLAVHVPLLLSQTTTRAESLLIALLMALVIAALEAIARQGLDNLYLPLLAFGMLGGLVGFDSGALGLRLGVLCLIVLVGFTVRLRSYLNVEGLITALLMVFGLWALLSKVAVAPALVTALVYVIFSPKQPGSQPLEHGAASVFAVAGPGLLWAAMIYALPGVSFGGLHLAFALASGLIALNHAFAHRLRFSPCHPVLFGSVIGGLSLLLGALLAGPLPAPSRAFALSVFLGIVVCPALFWAWQFRRPLDHQSEGRWVRQFCVILACSATAIIPELFSFSLP